MKVLIVYYSL
jgi:NAD(P)H dehydrogenase (quinone)